MWLPLPLDAIAFDRWAGALVKPHVLCSIEKGSPPLTYRCLITIGFLCMVASEFLCSRRERGYGENILRWLGGWGSNRLSVHCFTFTYLDGDSVLGHGELTNQSERPIFRRKNTPEEGLSYGLEFNAFPSEKYCTWWKSHEIPWNFSQ